jgi:hypothetical protein
MNTKNLVTAGKIRQTEPSPQNSSRRKIQDLQWIDSEWFQVWLKLARDGKKSDQN